MEDKRIAAEEILAEMVPMVTEEQERKRRQTESKKLTEENRKSTARAARPREGSDGDYKEFKIVTF